MVGVVSDVIHLRYTHIHKAVYGALGPHYVTGMIPGALNMPWAEGGTSGEVPACIRKKHCIPLKNIALACAMQKI